MSPKGLMFFEFLIKYYKFVTQRPYILEFLMKIFLKQISIQIYEKYNLFGNFVIERPPFCVKSHFSAKEPSFFVIFASPNAPYIENWALHLHLLSMVVPPPHETGYEVLMSALMTDCFGLVWSEQNIIGSGDGHKIFCFLVRVGLGKKIMGFLWGQGTKTLPCKF